VAHTCTSATLQEHEQLGLCCGVSTYAALEPPASWQQQQQQQQQDELVVPDLPDLSRVLGPLQQVTTIALGTYDNLVEPSCGSSKGLSLSARAAA
jgi:hypothetical protein